MPIVSIGRRFRDVPSPGICVPFKPGKIGYPPWGDALRWFIFIRDSGKIANVEAIVKIILRYDDYIAYAGHDLLLPWISWFVASLEERP